MNTCETCQFWVRRGDVEDVEDGFCRRNPPQVIAYTRSTTDGSSGDCREVITTVARSEWPMTQSSDRCGEYRDKHL